MRNTADVTGGKPIAVLLQSFSGVSAINPLWRKERGAILLFCPRHHTRQSEINSGHIGNYIRNAIKSESIDLVSINTFIGILMVLFYFYSIYMNYIKNEMKFIRFKFTSEPPWLGTVAMLIIKCFSTIIMHIILCCTLYLFKKSRIKIRSFVLKI
jgi:hypothetical protein